MKSVYNNHIDCYGCGACMNACPKQAIHMEPDKQGFYYPIIDENKCINCGICKSVCQIGKENNVVNEKSETCIGFKNTDLVRAKSSSGGAFSAVVKCYSNIEGYIYGACFDNTMTLKHCMNRIADGTEAFMGSKYIQSDLGEIYQDILRQLETNTVIFSGTPCQIAALNCYLNYFRGKTNNLITIDIVCHGVPSPKIWKEYISIIEEKHHSPVKGFVFRDKTRGWRGYHILAYLADGRIIKDESWLDSFGVLFSKNLFLRPSCYHCPYSSMCRPSDITIADFWGIEKTDKEFSDNLGVSSIIPNTHVGENIVDSLSSVADYRTKEYKSDVLKQPNLHKSTDYPQNYDCFWKAYEKKGIKHILKRFGNISCLYVMKDRLDNFLYRH